MNELLLKLIDEMKALSPYLWEILVRQAYNEAIGYIVWCIVCLVISIALFIIANKLYIKYKIEEEKENSTSDISIVLSFSSIGSLTFLLFFINLTICITQIFVNPEYYAIQLILSKIK